MRNLLMTYVVLVFSGVLFGQQNTVLLHSYFKDRLFDNTRKEVYSGSSFLPAYESEYDLNYQIRDSSVQYYELTEILFKKHLLEFKGDNYYLTISPVADISRGKDFEDTNDRTLFQNTRGIFIEADLTSKFSFSSSFFENQGRYTQYESAYYRSIGELYPKKSDSTYFTQNAVIPGSARTKMFDGDGFDYGFAMGNIVYRPFKKLILEAGNTHHFIGDGYRSILLSDNSVPAPNFRLSYKISDKWEVNIMRMRLFNLMRKPASTSAEAYYETKGFSVNYITFSPIEKLSLSLFEGTVWSRGDSIRSKRVNPLFFNPVPGINGVIIGNQEVNPVLGLNASFSIVKSHRVYSQFAITQFQSNSSAFQFGYRGYNLFSLRNLMIQLECNIVSSNMYASPNDRLNYSGYNLPLAHVKGNGFQEYIVRGSYEWKRIYLDIKSIYYQLKNYKEIDLLPVDKEIGRVNGNIMINSIELGYRFNRKMNLSIFGSLFMRNDEISGNKATLINVGLRTGIMNRYTDF